jgi:DNA-binding CsgD family transcriptional regulator/tetratricopeptide (TPR) repeat protein
VAVERPSSRGTPGNADEGLVGRDREQTALRDALAAALRGRGGLVLVGGEAGIGKTTLAEAVLGEAIDQGALALVGRCYDLAETPPYGPWVEAIARAPADGGLPAPPDLSGGASTGQAALFAAVRDYLAAVATRRPLVLLLDDLHWADPGSLDLLRVVARDLADLPLLLLATYRADELARQHPLYALLPLLVRESRVARLELHPLADDDLRALARRYDLAPPDADRLVAYLRDRAEGNPFYAGELLRTLEEARVLAQVEGRWTLGDLAGVGVPSLLRQVLDARVDRLGDGARTFLATAAVIGQEVPLGLWASVAETDEAALLDTAERAVAARLLDETPDGAAVRFRHALIRAALYEGLGALRRRGLHRRAADALIAAPAPDPDAVAYHLRQAGDPRAVEWLVRAGERAQQSYAWLSAAERFEAALALLEAQGVDAAERGWFCVRVTRLIRLGDRPRALAYAERAIALAKEAGDRGLEAFTRIHRGYVRCQAGMVRDGVADLAAGVTAQEALTPDELARLAARRANLGDPLDEYYDRPPLAIWLNITGRYAEAATFVGRFAPLLTAPPDSSSSTAGEGRWALAGVHVFQERVEDARQEFAAARAAYRVAGRFWDLGWAALFEMLSLFPYQADQPRERERAALDGEDAWRRATGVLPADTPTRLSWLLLLALAGEWGEARALAAAARAIGGYAASFALGPLGVLARDQGEAVLAWDVVREALPGGPETEPGEAWYLTATVLQRLAAALALDAGDLPLAHAWLAAHDRWLGWSGAPLGRAEGELGWAAYHRAAGDLAAARDHAERVLAHARAPRQPLALLAAHRLLGELATAARAQADARAHLDAALALADACAAPYERALTLLALAELHHAAGGRDAARPALDDARAILTPLGARPALARADGLAARLDASPAAASPATTPMPFGLSARELDVLRLVAEGLTDAQVAERLFVSRHTVNAHLRAIYGKLGVNTRAAAARLALEHGLT